MAKQWLMKSEPDTFSISDLERVKVEPWSGVRSYFARAHMRAMSVGDQVLFHHSSVDPPGVAGLAKVVRTGVVDETQFDPESKYYDPKATRETPVWDCVDVEYVETFPHFVAMDRLRTDAALADMMVLRRGMRLSVQPVGEAEYARVVELGHTAPPPVPPKEPTVLRQKAAKKKKGNAKTPSGKKLAAKAKLKKKPRAR
ncbi:MAG: EVE domain-containing protein [Deltaproteobacteria bacterium]|nr:EVE domain-containing protein [Deltaproteobacteria bacterium]